MQRVKKILTDALAIACLVILSILFIGMVIVGMMYLHDFMLDILNENCYTNMFGEVICKVK